jgi:hypothetical protein
MMEDEQLKKNSKKKEREKEKRDGLQKIGGVNYEAVVDRQVELDFYSKKI